MLKMYYSKDGEAYSDFTVEKTVEDLTSKVAEGHSETVYFSTENFAYAIRLAVKAGKIPPEKVMLDMGEGDVGIDLNGRMKYSEYYNVVSDKWLDTLLCI